MAGYFLYSLDTAKFLQLVERPTDAQMKRFCKCLAEALLKAKENWEDGDPLAQWSTSPKALEPKVRERLEMPDWYGDLSRVGQETWERVMWSLCANNKKELGFRVEGDDSIYWDVLEVAWVALKVPRETITDVALSRFGISPYRRQPAGAEPNGKQKGKRKPKVDEDPWNVWHPTHSMHLPAEVQQMLTEVKSVEGAILASSIEGVRGQYEDELLPTLERLANEERMLFVQVDT